ncbi:universal stress protein [Streptomyces sp. NPDC054841]
MDRQDSAPRVVVGVDGSPSSHEALRWAVRHAGLIGATVEAVEAYELPGAHGWSAPMVDAGFDAEVARESLAEEIRNVLGDSGGSQVRQVLLRGNPVEALVKASEGAELLVVGSRGRGGFARVLLGSVSQQCALYATCPVVIVRPEAAAAPEGA